MWDFGNNLNWDLVLRQNYLAVPIATVPLTYSPIPPKLISVDTNVLLIGTRNTQAKPTWFTAGWVVPRLNFSPSSTSEFTGLVQGYSRYKLSLNKLNLVRFENFDLIPYAIEISIAKWHKEMLLEIWKYSGQSDDLEAQLDRIEEEIMAVTGQ